MLVLRSPELTQSAGKVRLKAIVEQNRTQSALWFEADAEAAPWLLHERADAFAIPLLLRAMRLGIPLRLEAPLSARLRYTWSAFLSPALARTVPGLREVPLECDEAVEPVKNVGAVGTGLSCGVDSFCTIAEHFSTHQQPGYRLTHCAVFDVGNHRPLPSDPSRTDALFAARVAQARAAADEMHLPLVVLGSNIDDFIPLGFATSHTFRNASAVLALQKLFRVYYYSSGHSAYDFRFSSADSGDYDLFTLPMLGAGSIDFFPSGTLLTRVEKTKRIAAFPASHGHLNVCLYEGRNCSACEKCLRTLLTLDVIGALDKYARVFDLKRYALSREWFIGYVLAHARRNPHYREIAAEIEARGFLRRPHAYFRGRWWRQRIARAVGRRMGARVPTF